MEALDRLLALDLELSPPSSGGAGTPAHAGVAQADDCHRGNRAASPRRDSLGHNPLKAETRVRIPLEPPTTIQLRLMALGFA
jgi:hypothetical protein